MAFETEEQSPSKRSAVRTALPTIFPEGSSLAPSSRLHARSTQIVWASRLSSGTLGAEKEDNFQRPSPPASKAREHRAAPQNDDRADASNESGLHTNSSKTCKGPSREETLLEAVAKMNFGPSPPRHELPKSLLRSRSIPHVAKNPWLNAADWKSSSRKCFEHVYHGRPIRPETTYRYLFGRTPLQ